MRFSRRPVKVTGLLRMTNWVAEIATSHKTLRAMTEQDVGVMNQAPTKDLEK